MAKGSEKGEVVVSSVRSGMKREFAMMMKAQAECGISIGERRVTRSQNAAPSNGLLSRNIGNNSNERKSEAKKRRKQDKSVKVEETVEEAVVGVVKMEQIESRDVEKVVVTSEDEDPKSDVVDGNLDEQGKGDLVELGNEEGGGILDDNLEKQNVEVEIDSDTVRNEVGTDRNVAKVDVVNDIVLPRIKVEVDCNVIKEVVDDNARVIDDCDTVDLEIINAVLDPVGEERPKSIGLQEKKVNASSEDGKGDQTVVKCVEGIGETGVLEKPSRRFTRSALKQKDEAMEASATRDVKGMGPVESDAVSPMTIPLKMEMEMPKNIELKRSPLKLKDLLETGLLEGLTVQYMRGSKVKGQPEIGLSGVINGSGILCCCDNCNGDEVVTPNQFELHAGSSNKRPPEYIYLENGNTLRDVLNICKNTPSDSLEEAVQNAIGCSKAKRSSFCLKCKARTGRTKLLCDSCVVLKESLGSAPQMTDNSDRSSICVSDTKSSEQMASSVPRSKRQGRLTRKDLRMHKLVFEEDVLPDGTALAYFSRGHKLLEGYKKGAGIFCYCCENEVSPSQFEAHAGCGSRRKPYLHIYTSNGVSLHELSIRLSKERKLSAEENDDLCSICADGGDLLCCDNCPRAFHVDCVSLPVIPQGTWYCRYCENMFQKEKFVESNVNAVAAGRVAGIDPLEQITKRSIRIVETLDADICACVLCRGREFSKTGFGPLTVIICDQCEKEYHIGCLKEHNMDDLKELPTGKWFCCVECNRVHSALEKLVAEGEMGLPETLLDMVKNKHAGKESDDIPDLNIKWRLLRGKLASEDTRKFLSGAVTLFHERFDPIADASTSRLDVIPQMVYGRSFKDQDLGGMYTAVLFVNSVMVSAGIIRIFGQEIAELPLVATDSDYQGQGYFQCLFSCMENLLGSLEVRDLVLPAAEEAEAIWVNKFGFEKVTQEQLRGYRKDYQMMIFQGTSVLHKLVQKSG